MQFLEKGLSGLETAVHKVDALAAKVAVERGVARESEPDELAADPSAFDTADAIRALATRLGEWTAPSGADGGRESEAHLDATLTELEAAEAAWKAAVARRDEAETRLADEIGVRDREESDATDEARGLERELERERAAHAMTKTQAETRARHIADDSVEYDAMLEAAERATGERIAEADAAEAEAKAAREVELGLTREAETAETAAEAAEAASARGGGGGGRPKRRKLLEVRERGGENRERSRRAPRGGGSRRGGGGVAGGSRATRQGGGEEGAGPGVLVVHRAGAGPRAAHGGRGGAADEEALASLRARDGEGGVGGETGDGASGRGGGRRRSGRGRRGVVVRWRRGGLEGGAQAARRGGSTRLAILTSRGWNPADTRGGSAFAGGSASWPAGSTRSARRRGGTCAGAAGGGAR